MKFTESDEEIFYKVLYDKAPLNLELSEQMLAKVSDFGYLFSLLPGVVNVAICNSLAFKNPTDASDIDLFFILKSNRFFIYRWIITFIFYLFKQRRNARNIANRFCLSFFVSDNSLNLKDCLINNDVYFYFWFKNLVFLDKNYSQQEVFVSANKWYEDEYVYNRMSLYSMSKFASWLEIVLSVNFFVFFETILADYSLKRIARKNSMLPDLTGVIATRGILKFHVKDIRKEISDKFYLLRSK